MSNSMQRPEGSVENVRSSSRERVPTEKGLECQTQLLQRDGDLASTAWERQMETTKGALAFSTDITLLQRERYKLETRMNDLTNAYRKFIEVLDSEESKSNATDKSETCLRETEEVFKSLNSRISQLQSERREQYEERESVYSRRSSRRRSSRKSGKSSD